MTTTLLVPDIGDFKNVPVIEILVEPGDAIQPDDALLTLESDKATIDVPASAGGMRAGRAGAGGRVERAGRWRGLPLQRRFAAGGRTFCPGRPGRDAGAGHPLVGPRVEDGRRRPGRAYAVTQAPPEWRGGGQHSCAASTMGPVVVRDSRARCASAASRRANTKGVSPCTPPAATVSNSTVLMALRASRRSM